MDRQKSASQRIGLLILAGTIGLFWGRALAASVNVSASIPSMCGNGIKDAGEQCDGSQFGGETCDSLGYNGGTLLCNASCTIETSQCTLSSGNNTNATVSVGGGSAPISSFVTVYVTSSVSNLGATGTILLSGSVSDYSKVSSFWFMFDGSQVGQKFSSQPYTLLLDVASTSDGVHVLQAMATNRFGNIAASQPVNVIINRGTSPSVPISLSESFLQYLQARLASLAASFAKIFAAAFTLQNRSQPVTASTTSNAPSQSIGPVSHPPTTTTQLLPPSTAVATATTGGRQPSSTSSLPVAGRGNGFLFFILLILIIIVAISVLLVIWLWSKKKRA